MKRKNFDYPKLRRSSRRTKINENIYGSTFIYIKFFLIWAVVLLADFILEFRFEYLWPFWLLIRSVYDSFKYQGLAFSIFFICIALTSDMICLLTIPVHWLFFAASTYVWVQFIWHTERGICLPTISLWLLFVYIEASVRLRELKNVPFHLDLCRPFAAHCIGYPMVTLGFGFKSYIGYRLRQKKQRDIAKENNFYHELLKKALPVDYDQQKGENVVESNSRSYSNIDKHKNNVSHVNAHPKQNGHIYKGGDIISNDLIINGSTPFESCNNLSIRHIGNGHCKTNVDVDTSYEIEEESPGSGGRIFYSITKLVHFFISVFNFNARSPYYSPSGKLSPQGDKHSHEDYNIEEEEESDEGEESGEEEEDEFLQQQMENNSRSNSEAHYHSNHIYPTGHHHHKKRSSLTNVPNSVNHYLTPLNNHNSNTFRSKSDTNSSNTLKATNNPTNIISNTSADTSKKSDLFFEGNTCGISDQPGPESRYMEMRPTADNISKPKNTDGTDLNSGKEIASHNSCNIKNNVINDTINKNSLPKINVPPASKINGFTGSVTDYACVYKTSAGDKTGKYATRSVKIDESKNNTSAYNSLIKPSKQLLYNEVTHDTSSKPKSNILTEEKDYSNTFTGLYKMEIDIKKLKNDLQASRLCEQELRHQITTLQNNDKCCKNELGQYKSDNEILQNKINNLVTIKQQDKLQLTNFEKKLIEEQKLRAKLELQLTDKKFLNAKRPYDDSNHHMPSLVSSPNRTECTESCKNRRKDLENDIRQLCKDAKIRDDQLWVLEKEVQTLRQMKDQKNETEILITALSAMKNKNVHLETSLNAETKLKLDLFSALSEAKRNLEINQTLLSKREREISELKSRLTELRSSSVSTSRITTQSPLLLLPNTSFEDRGVINSQSLLYSPISNSCNINSSSPISYNNMNFQAFSNSLKSLQAHTSSSSNIGGSNGPANNNNSNSDFLFSSSFSGLKSLNSPGPGCP
ncbi:unnamed protein product [Gordionus sp. m RMFG-2023]|uniref:macoilin-like n=1 Tax=Gordionus sp. m RMFG-2023 TaxID=3053472 RepID=UPI0030E419A9